MKTYRVTIQMKFIKQYFLVARFVLQCITELRHKKRLPRFHRVTLMVNRVEVWVNKKKAVETRAYGSCFRFSCSLLE